MRRALFALALVPMLIASFAFAGEAEIKAAQTGPGSIIQQVLIVGPDGKDYEAVYTLQQRADGSFKITGCSLRASTSVST
ncbi:DUF4864 domain-containing protein [Mesorhizobium sp. WSM4313]|uniref:DUF4864 domain-containing protein n=1 Tax=Mesorhizobium sp. WSM4313 TaxID=2029412 RepID=UPI000BB06E19|nr:DUF4864 domain-containing protein [Mesorhizobium sp. WSM4313]PBB21629.1 hypothetical protein CK219_03380 [Mesorhizobium sp. WSM4313]